MKTIISNKPVTIILIKRVLSFIYLLVLASGVQSYAQQVALIISRDIPPYQAAVASFREACDFRVDEYSLNGDIKNGPEILNSIWFNKDILLVAVGSEALEVAVSQKKRPILYTMVLAPKNNRSDMTGVFLEIPALVQLTILHKLVPNIRNVGLIYNPATSQSFISDAKNACQNLGFILVPVPVNSDREVDEAAKSLTGKIDALWMIPDPVNLSPLGAEAILLFSLENQIPILAPSEKFVKSGALVSVSADYHEMGIQTARMANVIVKGGQPSEFPGEGPRKYSIALNLKVAKQIGLKIPKSVIDRVEKIY